MVADARAEADRIRTDSQEKAEEVRQAAEDLMHGSRKEADRLVVGLSSRRDALATELEEMRERMLSMVQSIDAIEQEALEHPQAAILAPSEQQQPPALELPDHRSPETDTPEQFFTDPQFAGMWGDDAVSEPTLEDVDPEEPSY